MEPMILGIPAGAFVVFSVVQAMLLALCFSVAVGPCDGDPALLRLFGMLMLLVYQIMAQQVAWVHDGAGEAFRLFANPVDAVMYAWLFIVMTVCAVLQTRKGYVDTNRFGQTEHIPTGYFLLISGITGIASALAIAAMRCIAEVQIVPIESVFWGANLATGVVFGVTIFVAVFGALCLAFFEAKQRRAKIEAELDCPDDL